MTPDMETEEKHLIFERIVISIVAILSGISLITLAVMGPLVLGLIQYRSSPSAILQIMGADFVNAVLIAPLCIIGGILHLVKRDSAKYFLILPSITLIYTGLTVGIGQEWGNPAYTGNVENYFGLFWFLIVGGIIVGMSALSMFNDEDAPEFKPKSLKIYAIIIGLFLLLFLMMWISEVSEVITTGDTSSGSYQSAPVLFWVIRYFDLGVTIPLGYIALYLLLTRPKKAYGVILLFFGFFVTLGSAVNSMGWMMYLGGDPELQLGGLAIFGILGITSWAGLLFLVKDKILGFRK